MDAIHRLIRECHFRLEVSPDGRDCRVEDDYIGRFPSEEEAEEQEDFELIPYTEEQLNTIVYSKDYIAFKVQGVNLENEETQPIFSVRFNLQKPITLQEFINYVIQFENYTRPYVKWFDRVDHSHICFEGITPLCFNENTFVISWGS